MALYIVNINDRSEKGKAFITLLKNDPSAKIQTMEEFEAKEAKHIMKAIRKAEKSKLLSFEEGTKEFEKLRRRIAK